MPRAKFYNGKTITEWTAETGLKRSVIANRLKEGWTIEEAVNTQQGCRRVNNDSLSSLAIKHKMSPKTLKKRIQNGMSIDEALSFDYRQNIINQRFGRLKVISETDPKRDPSGRPRRRYLCQCDCGNIVCVIGENLKKGSTQSCGCLANELTKKRNSKDLTGMTFGYLTAIKPVGSGKGGVKWLCKCKCGNDSFVLTCNLLSGNTLSCGCYNLEQISKREKAEIAGQRFGNVVAVECVGQNKYKNYLWKCVCDCGTKFVVPASRLLIGETRSCGCVHSRGEQYIANYFAKHHILFKKKCLF